MDAEERRVDLRNPRRPRHSTPLGGHHARQGKVFVHVLDWQDELLALPKIANVKSAKLLATGAAIELKEIPGGAILRLPQSARDPVDTIVVLETQR